MDKNLWFKSTGSGAAGHCVEAFWKTSSKSGAAHGACVEVKAEDERILVRDTKDNGAGAVLSFTGPEWDAFITGAKDGEFDRA